MSQTEPGSRPKGNIKRLGLAAFGVAAVAIAAAIWVSNAGLTGAGTCKAEPAAVAAIDKAATGQLAALQGTGTGRGYADLAFTDANGAKKTIADFKGKALLVNFWASWCIP